MNEETIINNICVTGIYPAKEGLKRIIKKIEDQDQESYRHLSSKRRIETRPYPNLYGQTGLVTGIYPAKEGLKQEVAP